MENQVKLFFLSLLQQRRTKSMETSDNSLELSVMYCIFKAFYCVCFNLMLCDGSLVFIDLC